MFLRRHNYKYWPSLAKLMPVYRAVTTVSVGDGRTMAFWLDPRLPGGALSVQMSSLFSHTTMPAASVAHVFQHGLAGVLVPRLNHAGARECAMLLPIIRALALTTEPDVRTLRLGCDKGVGLSSACLYQLCHFGGVLAPYADFVYKNYAPSHVRFFAWLLVQARIQTRDVPCGSTLWRRRGLAAPSARHPWSRRTISSSTALLLSASGLWWESPRRSHPFSCCTLCPPLARCRRGRARPSSSFVVGNFGSTATRWSSRGFPRHSPDCCACVGRTSCFGGCVCLLL